MTAVIARRRGDVIADWIRRESDVFVAAMLDGILASVPELSTTDDPARGLTAALRSHVPGIARAFADPSSTATLPAEAEQWTRGLVHDGVPLTAALRAFERGHADASRMVVGALRGDELDLAPPDRADETQYASSRLFDYANTIIAQAISAYIDEQAKVEHQDESSRVRAVNGLLHGNLEPRIAERSIAYRIDALHVGYTLWADGPAERTDLRPVGLAIGERCAAWQHLWVPADDGSLHGWLSCPVQDLRTAAGDFGAPVGVHAAFGDSHRDLSGFRLTHREAIEARRAGMALCNAGPTFYEDVAVLILASRDRELARAFVQRHLGAIAGGGQRQRTLRDTLRVYLEQRASPTATAARLRMHRNTIVKRIERTEELLGGPIDRGSLNLRVALELARIEHS